jgi:hypothetical protein
VTLRAAQSTSAIRLTKLLIPFCIFVARGEHSFRTEHRPSVKYFTQSRMNATYKTYGPVPDVLARLPGDFTEEHYHEDPDYRTGRDRYPRNVRGREDPAT